jgi:hypothetical protein
MMNGVANLTLTNGDVSDAIQCGLGFCEIIHENVIISVALKELAIIDCLRSLIPFRDIIGRFTQTLACSPKPQTVGYMLEYLVAFGLIANLNPNNLYETKPFKHSFPSYIQSAEPNEIYFPNHCCDLDIVYKHNGVLYLVQVKFVDIISKQERLKACHTTDPRYFYWNYKGQMVLKGFEQERNAILRLLRGIKFRRMYYFIRKRKLRLRWKELR